VPKFEALQFIEQPLHRCASLFHQPMTEDGQGMMIVLPRDRARLNMSGKIKCPLCNSRVPADRIRKVLARKASRPRRTKDTEAAREHAR